LKPAGTVVDVGGAAAGTEPISDRLAELLDDMLAGKAPNAGRFCGNCYHPLPQERSECGHCESLTNDRPPAEKVPKPVIEAHRERRRRESRVVQAIAWGGLTLGVTLALVPLAFAGVTWWSIALFFGLMFVFYVLSANLANSVGDTIGYNWGRSGFRRRWKAFVAERDATPPVPR
jgi:hypothetical protein